MSDRCPTASKGYFPVHAYVRLLSGNKFFKSIQVLLVDAALIALAFSLAFLLRFDFHLPADERELFLAGLCLSLLTKPAVFLCLGFYRNIWRYCVIPTR